jgi:hypothetical protein|tara:strand:- start:13283 stop:13585 length:303 start_codon:yes stop_codon:yes gene_type:complete
MSDYKDYVFNQLNEIIDQIIEEKEIKSKETYDVFCDSLQKNINYHRECIDKCKQLLLLMNAGEPRVTSYTGDDQSPEARHAWDDFWNSFTPPNSKEKEDD